MAHLAVCMNGTYTSNALMSMVENRMAAWHTAAHLAVRSGMNGTHTPNASMSMVAMSMAA